MSYYCLKCKEKTECENTRVENTKNRRTIFPSKCVVCGIKKSKFIQDQEATGLLISWGIKTRLSQIAIFSNTLF